MGRGVVRVDVGVLSGVDRGVVTGKRCIEGVQAERRTRTKQVATPHRRSAGLYLA